MSLEEAKQYEAFVKKTVPQVAGVLGLKPRKLYVRMTDIILIPAMTHERTVFLNSEWFRRHPEDYGTIVHELAHAVMNIQVALEEETWLIEGLADYTRDILGYASTSGEVPSFPHYDANGIFKGYQTTAHFLLWIRRKHGEDEVKNLARLISHSRKLDIDKLESWLQQYRAEHT